MPPFLLSDFRQDILDRVKKSWDWKLKTEAYKLRVFADYLFLISQKSRNGIEHLRKVH